MTARRSGGTPQSRQARIDAGRTMVAVWLDQAAMMDIEQINEAEGLSGKRDAIALALEWAADRIARRQR